MLSLPPLTEQTADENLFSHLGGKLMARVVNQTIPICAACSINGDQLNRLYHSYRLSACGQLILILTTTLSQTRCDVVGVYLE